MLSRANEPIMYGSEQENPPTACAQEGLDYEHRCYVIDDLQADEHVTSGWHARYVRIEWRKVEE
jgi:hypothetical protein